jgi:hypothetical protein
VIQKINSIDLFNLIKKFIAKIIQLNLLNISAQDPTAMEEAIEYIARRVFSEKNMTKMHKLKILENFYMNNKSCLK